MLALLNRLVPRTGLYLSRLLTRMGFVEQSVLVPMAIIVGIITAAAAVSFHEVMRLVRDAFYPHSLAEYLYGSGIWLLIALPALGGLAVGLFGRYVLRNRAGHGVADVVESVTRGTGTLRTRTAIEVILTSGVTIGSGGSAGAEGPIVQIGAAIASGIGRLFQLSRAHYPVLIGCGTAAGISAIFNSPIGGVLFTLEVILFDFSVRTFTPVVISSVVANVTTQRLLSAEEANRAIFELPMTATIGFPDVSWGLVAAFTMLGILCGAVGVCLTRLMYATEARFAALPVPRPLRPALGAALMGVIGVAYVIIFGWILMERDKPFLAEHYPMPAFYGAGYGAVKRILQPEFYAEFAAGNLGLLLLFLVLAKIISTCLTLGSGGSGGVIAPSLFLGATSGGLLGLGFQTLGRNGGAEPHFYALVGMGAVLAAVVHAPLTALLILLDVTRNPDIVVPGMLATIVATGTARLLYPESIYSLGLRRRGVRVGTSSDLTLLRRMSLEEIPLEPVTVLPAATPAERLVELTVDTGVSDFVLSDARGDYAGMVVGDDLKAAVLQPQTLPLLLAQDVSRPTLPCVNNTDDLATVLATFSQHDVARLPVCLASNRLRVVGLVSRSALMRRYHRALMEG